MKNTPTIQTNRLILRQFTKDDVSALFEILSDQEVNTFLPMFPLQTLQEAKNFLDKHYLQTYQKSTGYHYAICLKQDNRPIGYVNIDDHDSHDFGYGLKKEFWHQGIVSEASQAVVEQLKKDGMDYITATHDINNPHSGAVMKKIGMTYQYSYVEQWQPKNIKVTFRMYQLNLDGNQDRVYQEYWNRYAHHFIEEIEVNQSK